MVDTVDELLSEDTLDELRENTIGVDEPRLEGLTCDDVEDIIEENEDMELEQLGKGMGRCVFDASDDYTLSVLKVAKDAAGQEQNKNARLTTQYTPMDKLRDTFAIPRDFDEDNVAMLQQKVEPLPLRGNVSENLLEIKDKLVEVEEDEKIACEDFRAPANLGIKSIRSGKETVLKDLGDCRFSQGAARRAFEDEVELVEKEES